MRARAVHVRISRLAIEESLAADLSADRLAGALRGELMLLLSDESAKRRVDAQRRAPDRLASMIAGGIAGRLDTMGMDARGEAVSSIRSSTEGGSRRTSFITTGQAGSRGGRHG